MRRILATGFILAWACVQLPAQFRYVGAEAQAWVSTKDLHHGDITLNYLNQFSTHHGYGVELSLPITFGGDLSTELSGTSTKWDVDGIWRRSVWPALGFRYRFFAGNAFYMGSALQVGLIRERFYADRYYFTETSGYEIMPVFLDYSLMSPFFRLSFETGFIATIGDRMFASFNFRGALEFTKCRVKELGEFELRPNFLQTFESYNGMAALGSVGIGLGVKL